MKISRPAIPIAAILVLAWFLSAGGLSGAAENIIANPSFEKGQNGSPAAWKTHTWQGKAEFRYASVGHGGGRSVLIEAKDECDAAWFTIVKVRPRSTYRLSGWIKTENVGRKKGMGALLNVHELQRVHTRAVTGTTDWTRVELIFDSGDADSFQINCLLGGWGRATGRAWYDDIHLERLSSAEMRPAVTIDATRTGRPISKYIYGQFIEHLGRCIYGGIWAEMVRDRKFFYPVGAEKSPWKALGGPGAVEMIRQGSYVGDQTPEIRPAKAGSPAGIAQEGLGLRKGREYVGRIILAGSSNAAPVEVSLVWGERPADRQTIRIEHLSENYAKTPLRFTAGGDTDDGRLEIVSRTGKGVFRIGTLSLMPADNVKGMRADTLKLLKELDAPIYRWPGGNFVSGYNWKDGIGERDKRPPRKNPAWKGIEPNDFGIDEYMAFCRELGTEPYIVVNSGLGDAKLAAEEVEYVNGPPDTPMGRLRAANGHREPYGVRFWGIGNEMYGKWQLGHMPLEKYIKKHNRFAEAMRAVDPSIKLVAVGAVGRWSEQMLAHCADHMDIISEHFYCGEKKELISHVRQLRDRIREIAAAHRRYRKTIAALEGKNIKVALDEWNYWYGKHVYGELGVLYHLKDALGVAAALNEYSRNGDIYFMANYAQTVNVIGCIKTTKTDAIFAATGLALKLYRRHFGVVPVEVAGDWAPLDIAAAWTAERKAITVAVVNPTRERLRLPVELKGARLAGTGHFWRITGPGPMAHNTPGKKPEVVVKEGDLNGVGGGLEVPALTATIFKLDVR